MINVIVIWVSTEFYHISGNMGQFLVLKSRCDVGVQSSRIYGSKWLIWIQLEAWFLSIFDYFWTEKPHQKLCFNVLLGENCEKNNVCTYEVSMNHWIAFQNCLDLKCVRSLQDPKQNHLDWHLPLPDMIAGKDGNLPMFSWKIMSEINVFLAFTLAMFPKIPR